MPPTITAIDIPYYGLWRSPNTSSSSRPSTAHSALLNASTSEPVASSNLGLPIIFATPDSGATASNTNRRERLVGLKPCDEVFGDANGKVVRCDAIGDMPVVARDSNGKLLRFVLTNVRLIPSFHYTLLSVTQLWEEQRIDARFRDLNHLQLPVEAGGFQIPYEKSVKLSTLALISEAELSASSPPPKPQRF